MATNNVDLFKLLLIGDRAGKSSLMTRFCDNVFDESIVPTIGIDFRAKTIEVDGTGVKVQIWDTSSLETFRSLNTAIFRGSKGIMVVYDVTSDESFKHVGRWIQKIKDYSEHNMKKMIVGNKCDLEDSRVVSRGRGQLVADDHGVMFYEVSGHKVTEAITDLVLSSTSITSGQETDCESYPGSMTRATTIKISLKLVSAYWFTLSYSLTHV